MQHRFQAQLSLALLTLGFAILGGSCGDRLSQSSPPAETPVAQAPATPVPVATPVAAVTPTPTSAAQPDPYHQAIDRASSAFNMGQAAQSQDDWRLVASRWQQAIAFLQAVPPAHPNYTEAQTKLTDYRRNLAYAEQQANRSVAPASGGVVVIAPPAAPPSTPEPTVAAASAPPEPSTSPRVYRAPIIGRAGGTPVINVTFSNNNVNRIFPMIVDTGASGTLITPVMAQALGVVPIGQTSVATASASSVTFNLGYVQSIEVDGAIAMNVPIAVSGPELDLGLLGHDFFGNYDVVIRQHEVEFRERV